MSIHVHQGIIWKGNFNCRRWGRKDISRPRKRWNESLRGLCSVVGGWRWKEQRKKDHINHFSTLKMEALLSSERSVTVYLTTRHNVSEDSGLYIHRRENLKSRLKAQVITKWTLENRSGFGPEIWATNMRRSPCHLNLTLLFKIPNLQRHMKRDIL
jgi:hypothetical protein